MLDQNPNQTIKSREISQRAKRGIAIVGFSGRFPGGANSPDLLWEKLKSGEDGVTEIRGDRWDLGWHNPDQDRLDRIYAPCAGQLDQIDGFDAEFFGISPREAQQIDPQQRLLLELAWETFEDAGIPARSQTGRDIGVFVGISNNDYGQIGATGSPDAYSNTGVAFSIAANRISYIFDLHGPSMAVDTACSASLVCIHQATQAILNGECAAALAGGVNILADIGPWLGFSRASMLSPEGRCKSFDESGNGYVRSEGGGLVLLKPLEDAERDGDHIHCVIRATGVNSDGRTLGLSMPNGDAQRSLLEQVYGESGVAADDVFYVEAHGTGTSVGDPIECEALGSVLGAPRTDGSLCHIGSIKSNIGHLEPASGIAGLTKIILSMKHREVPANLHYSTPNPKIDFDDWRLNVVDQPLPFPQGDKPVVIGINSFGFGGTNAHVILEEYRAEKAQSAAADAPNFLLISAGTEDALKELAAEYAAMLREPEADWAEIAAAAALCRTTLRMRLVIRAENAADAADRLDAWLAGEAAPGTAEGSYNAAKAATAFVFSGNGPQWWGMGREMLAENAVFRAEVEAIDAVFKPLSGWSLIDEMARPEEQSRIHLTEVAQPMLFAMQLGLKAAFEAEGITPDAVFGHSVGEVAAACASGALTREQGTQVIFHRSKAQATTAGMGKMAALGLGPEAAGAMIESVGGWLEIAAQNGPDAVTVAGDETALAALVDKVTAEGQFAKLLTLDYPFHTKAMDQIRDELLASLAELKPAATSVPFISTVSGEEMDGEALSANYWFDNVRQPVAFSQAVAHLLDEHGISLFVELGPHPVLKDYVAQTARAEGTPITALQSLRRPSSKGPESDKNNFATAVSAAHANGASQLDAVFARPARLPKLPAYPWQRTHHWRGSVSLPDTFVPAAKDHPLLGARLPRTDGLWEAPVDKNLLSYLKDHVVQGSAVFPAAGYLELLLAAAQQSWGMERVVDVESLQIERPLVLADEYDPLVQTLIDSRDGVAEISARRDVEAKDHSIQVRARVSAIEDCEAPKVNVVGIQERTPCLLSAQEHYADCAYRGLDYGEAFQGIRNIRLSPPDADQREALAEVKLDFLSREGLGKYRSHPSVFDSCLQATIALVAQNDKRNVSTLPIQFERVRSYAPLPAHVLAHVRIVRESRRSVVAEIDILSLDGTLLLSVEGGRCQKANLTGAAQSPLTSEWWRPDAAFANTGALPALPDLAGFAPQAAASDTDFGQTLDHIAELYAAQALDALRPAGDRFDMSSFARHARIRRDATPLLTNLISIAERAGYLSREGKGWVWSAEALGTPDAAWAEAFANNPNHQAELLLLAERGESLVARLKGEDVAEPSSALMDQVHDVAPFAAPLNQLCADAVEALVASWPKDRPIRILEIGGGSGGTASWLLPLLPAERADYMLTDPSESDLARAERRLSAHRFLRTAPVSALIDAHEQGLPRHYFDLVIASGLSRFGKSARMMLENLPSVMADGALVLAAAEPKGPAASLMLGEQAEINSALLETAGLKSLNHVEANGASLFLALGGPVDFAASTEALEPASYLLLAEDKGAFSQEVATALGASGQTATVFSFPEESGDAAIETLHKALEAARPDHVVLLAAQRSDGTPAEVSQAQMHRGLTTVALVRAMELARQDFECDLAIVTRGAFPECNGSAPLDPTEAALWGMGRVVGNEHFGLETRLVDLHAADETAAEAGWLADELTRRDDETEVQLAGGHRYVNRERVNAPADEARAAGQTADAFSLDFASQGGIDSLHLKALERREPAADEVEIAVRAAGLNFRDVLWCMGMLPEEAVEHGFSGPTIGMECAGEVVRVGADVTHVAPGDRVLAFASSCFGSHVLTEAKSVETMPDGMSFAAAATIPTTFLTAWYGLDYLARLEEDETILIHGAAGGVGLAAIQIAQAKGATIIGTAGSHQKRRMLERLGVHHVLNSRTLEFADQVMEITGGVGVDVVLNSLAGEAIIKGLNCLRPFGRFLEIGKRDLYANSRIGLRPFRNNLSYFGIDADTLLIERPKLAGRLFGEVIEQFRTGALNPLPHQVLPVSRAGEAFRAMQQSRHVGKLVVSMELDREGSLPVVSADNPVRAGGTYLVTGGLGGFGLATARWLAEQGATSLALISRSGAKSDEAKEALAAFEAAGVSARAFATDISDEAATREMLTAIRKEMPPLIGVIHSAAVIEDAPIANIEAEQFARVIEPKMIGAWNLHHLTLEDPLEIFVLYSSSSAVVGNPGQGAYVAANLYLDALAMERRARGLPGLAIGWGAIRDAGFLTRHENVADMLKSRTGLEATPANEALADLGLALAAGSSRVSVARFDLQRLAQMLPAAQTPRFAPIVPSEANAALSSEENLADILEAMPKAERRAFVVERVMENTARVLGTTASQINADKPLSDLGLDSLMAVELAGAIERDIGETVPVMQLLGVPSLSAVADFVAKSLGVEMEAEGAEAAVAGETVDIAAE